MKSEKEKVVYDSPKGAKNKQIILNHHSGPYPIKVIEENNVESYKFSSYLPDCIKTELLYLLKRRGEVFVLGLEEEKEGIQIGITGTGNSKLDNLELRLTMGREVLKKTGLLLHTRYVNFPKNLYKYDTKYEKWLCGNIKCSELDSFTHKVKKDIREFAKGELSDWATKSYKKYDNENAKIGLVIWEKSYSDIREKLLRVEKNHNLTKLLKKDNITSVCIVKLTKNMLDIIIKK